MSPTDPIWSTTVGEPPAAGELTKLHNLHESKSRVVDAKKFAAISVVSNLPSLSFAFKFILNSSQKGVIFQSQAWKRQGTEELKKKKNRGVCLSVCKCTYNEPSESIFFFFLQELSLCFSKRKGRSESRLIDDIAGRLGRIGS